MTENKTDTAPLIPPVGEDDPLEQRHAASRRLIGHVPMFVIVGQNSMANPLGSNLDYADERRFNPNGMVFVRVEDVDAALIVTLKSENGGDYSRADREIHDALAVGIDLARRLTFTERKVERREQHIRQLLIEQEKGTTTP